MNPSSRFIGAAGAAQIAERVRNRNRRSRMRAPIVVDILVHSPLWNAHRTSKAMLRRAIGEAACAVSDIESEVAVVLTDDSAMRTLNRNWRSKDVATNVLSFPASDNHPVRPAATGRRGNDRRARKAGGAASFLGDIVIAYETLQREARAEHKRFTHHLAHLVVHGYLHLVGYDHQAAAHAHEMEELESAILARLDVPNPYIEHGVQR
jgi:probable rRNA maturation factor